MKKKKSKKKLLIGAGVIAVVAVGGVSVLGGRSSGEEAVPQVEVVKAEIGEFSQKRRRERRHTGRARHKDRAERNAPLVREEIAVNPNQVRIKVFE